MSSLSILRAQNTFDQSTNDLLLINIKYLLCSFFPDVFFSKTNHLQYNPERPNVVYNRCVPMTWVCWSQTPSITPNTGASRYHRVGGYARLYCGLPLHYTTLYHTTLHYTTLHHTTLHYTTSRQTVYASGGWMPLYVVYRGHIRGFTSYQWPQQRGIFIL